MGDQLDKSHQSNLTSKVPPVPVMKRKFQKTVEATTCLSFQSKYRSASTLGSRLPSIASAKAKVAGAGEIIRPVSGGTQVNTASCLQWLTFRVKIASI